MGPQHIRKRKKYACGVRQHCIISWPKTQGLCWHYWGTLLKHLSHGHLPLTAEICLWTPAVVLKKHWEMCVGNSCMVCSCSCHILQGDVVLLCFLSLCLRPCIVEVMQRGRSGAGLKMSDGLVSLDLTRTDQCYFDLKIERRFKPQMRSPGTHLMSLYPPLHSQNVCNLNLWILECFVLLKLDHANAASDSLMYLGKSDYWMWGMESKSILIKASWGFWLFL